MIVFDLFCDNSHAFEGWFRSSEEYNSQQASGLLTCPVCGSENITKKLSASRLNLGKPQQLLAQLSAIQNDAEVLTHQISEYIRANYEDVGNNFARQALKMHYGEIEERNIKGTATVEETTELKEEGVDILPLPADPKSKLN